MRFSTVQACTAVLVGAMTLVSFAASAQAFRAT
jgi:hypothetical protein